jgi:hypothetical protein
MPNIKKMTDTKKTCLSVAFRFRPGQAGSNVSNHTLKLWCKDIKRAIKAENLQIHTKVHKGVGRKTRRVGIKRKSA